jgi:hypothetical protein
MKFEQLCKDFLKEAKVRRSELRNEQSQYDLMVTDIVHFFENERCDAVTMAKAAKLLKEVTQDRRKTKTELEKLSSIIDTMTQGMVKFDQKRYKYRTAVIDNIFNMKG